MGKNLIDFKINEKKALETLLFLASKKGTRINIYCLLKMIFAADKHHLNTHARPVTGDVYIKMQYGTVPSTIYDFVKQDPLALGSLNLDSYPFKIEGHFLVPTRSADVSCFSESDIEALEIGFKEYDFENFRDVETKNHQEKCWLQSELNKPIDFESMIENQEVLEYLKEMAPFSMAL